MVSVNCFWYGKWFITKQKGRVMKAKVISLTIIIIMLGTVYVLPIAISFVKSLSYEDDVFTLKQFWELFTTNYTYFNYFWNSMLYATVTMAVCLIISFPLGFLFACVKFRGRDILFFAFIVVMLLPFQATLLPNYIQLRSFHMLNSRWALMLPMFFSPFAIFMFRQFMKSIPKELLEYAFLETSSVLAIFRHVVFPQVKTAICALAILIFCESWNMVEQALIFTTENERIAPLSVILSEIPENVSFAGATVYIYPILVLFLIFKETISESMEKYKL